MSEVRLIDANAAADKIMRETETHADEIGVRAVAIMIAFARALRDETDFPTIDAEPVRLIPKEVSATDIDQLTEMIKESLLQAYPNDVMFTAVRQGRWIECDYKHMEHGMIETEPKAGICCSECRAAFQKKRMTYHQYCAACGARMDGGADNG